MPLGKPRSPSFSLCPGQALVVGLLLLVALPGCRLEDRMAEEEGGDLPAVEVGIPEDRGPRSTGEADAPPPVVELGEPFWREGETRAVELTGRFVSPEARAALLSPEATVAEVAGVRWRLEEILVTVDVGRGPAQARWVVAGPPAVIEHYLAGLRDHPADRAPVLELGVLELEPRPAGP
jgi:hypothetical protein